MTYIKGKATTKKVVEREKVMNTEKFFNEFIENVTDEVIIKLKKKGFDNSARFNRLKEEFRDCNVVLASLVYDEVENYMDIDLELLYNIINDLYIEEEIADLMN